MSKGSAGCRFPWVTGLLLMGLAACQTTPPQPAPSPAPVPEAVPEAAPSPVLPHARVLSVRAEESLLQILVYRGGPMARLGHNHVIASRHLEGEVSVTEDPTQARFEIRIPVSDLTVDEPAMREEAGADFPGAVPQSAREGTRKNLLSKELLDGVHYPVIRLRALEVRGSGERFEVTVEITLKDQARTVRVPVLLSRDAESWRARGEFPLKQTDLGLKPFSVAMGTLVVLDEMKIRFDVTAK